MTIFFAIVSILFLLVFTKKLFFWVYLWQLKEYHIGRFLDHFRTYKGKHLILNAWLLLKVIVLVGIYFSARFGFTGVKMAFVYSVGVIFFAEGLLFLRSVMSGAFKRPVITKKTTVILSSGLSLEVLLMFALFLLEFKITRFTFSLLFLDIAAPLIFSFLVLAYQPLAVFLRARLIRAAKRKRELLKKLLVIGVTGSYGKTSTKDFLAAILAERFRTLATKEHQNSEVGISECILNELWPEHEVFVCEMGAYNRGGIRLLCGIAKPQIGVLTGINEQHMATFGSQENIIKTKYELIESLPKSGAAFFNAKNKYCVDLYGETTIKKFLYGENASSSFEENLAGAVAVAKYLGMNDEEINRGIQKIKAQQKSRVKKGINGINIIDSTYSANPTGIISDLDDLRAYSGKKVLVMPCLIELGRASKEVHQRIGKKIAEVCDLAIITTRDRFGEIKENAGEKAVFMEKPGEIMEKIRSFCQEGDTVLLESRVPPRVIKSLII